MRKPLVAGNWKMHGALPQLQQFADGLKDAGVWEASTRCDVLLLPPVAFLGVAVETFAASAVSVGAQNVHTEESGAYTGEVSAEMVASLGASATLVGHSERRQLNGETDAVVAEKFAAAERAGLQPILCVGETLEERDAGEAEAVVRRQLQAVVDRVGGENFGTAVVAYEPVWAIGTGRTATAEQAQSMHAAIRQFAAEASDGTGLRILYGGSVKPENAAELFAEADIDGGLIGGASLDADSFAAIVKAAG